MAREQIAIPKPCSQSWDAMARHGDLRFCEACGSQVHDLSAMTRKRAERLVRTGACSVCGRVALNANGEMRFRAEPTPAWRQLLPVTLLTISASVMRASDSKATCWLEVGVTDTTEARVAGALVTISGANPAVPLYTGTTNAGGLVRTQLEPGHYNLLVQSPGFASYNQEVELACSTDSPTRIDANLRLGEIVGQTVLVIPPSSNLFVRAWDRTRNLFWRLRRSV